MSSEMVMSWVLAFAAERELDLESQIHARRAELKERAFFIAD
jgi:hypothetical protein